jgi:hypothetical protein
MYPPGPRFGITCAAPARYAGTGGVVAWSGASPTADLGELGSRHLILQCHTSNRGREV